MGRAFEGFPKRELANVEVIKVRRKEIRRNFDIIRFIMIRKHYKKKYFLKY